MKRFAVAEDREFEIGGEVFKWVYPFWEDIAKIFDVDDESQDTIDNSVRGTISDLIERIAVFIDPDFNDGVNRWKALANRRKNPIPHSQYSELYRWLLEVTSDPHPTDPSSPSEDGQQNGEATSEVGSSSPVAGQKK